MQYISKLQHTKNKGVLHLSCVNISERIPLQGDVSNLIENTQVNNDDKDTLESFGSRGVSKKSKIIYLLAFVKQLSQGINSVL